MSTRLASLLSLVALFAGACGSSDDAPSLNHYADELSESLTDFEAGLSAHHLEVLAETDFTRVQEVERAHVDTMAMRMGRMQDAQDSMDLCADHMAMMAQMDAATPFRDAREAMMDAIDEASVELERHSAAMLRTEDIDGALSEEHAHQAAMDRVMERMRMHDDELARAMLAMEDAGMSMMCPMRSHMHGRR